jgi:hypothetical protein
MLSICTLLLVACSDDPKDSEGTVVQQEPANGANGANGANSKGGKGGSTPSKPTAGASGKDSKAGAGGSRSTDVDAGQEDVATGRGEGGRAGGGLNDRPGRGGSDSKPTGAGKGGAGVGGRAVGEGGQSGSGDTPGSGVRAECVKCEESAKSCEAGCSASQPTCDSFPDSAKAKKGPKAGTSLKQLCNAVLDCMYTTRCAAFGTTDCLCGQFQDPNECFNGLLGGLDALEGQCKEVIVAAAESEVLSEIGAIYQNPMFAVGLATSRIDQCDLTACPRACHLCIAEGDAANCPTEPEPTGATCSTGGAAGGGAGAGAGSGAGTGGMSL